MKSGIVGRTTEGFFRYQAWPTVTKDANGVLYAAASGHRLGHVCPFGKNYLYISHDEGESWEGPTVINDTYLDDRDAGLCAWGEGNLLLTWFNQPQSLYDQREATTPLLREPLAKGVREAWKTLPQEQTRPGSFLRISHDGGRTWSEKIQVPVTSPHGPIRREDGSLFYLGKAFFWPGDTVEQGHVYAFESRDDGRSWTCLCEVEFPEGFDSGDIHEPYAIELPDGTILGGLRGSGPKMPARNGVFTTFSTDGGRSFSKPQLLDHSGTPPHFLRHSSGAVILTYGRRIAPFGERARISYDGGKTWGEELIISREAPDWDLGYPSSVELSDGSILTVYYQKYPADPYNSILYTKWKLPKEREIPCL